MLVYSTLHKIMPRQWLHHSFVNCFGPNTGMFLIFMTSQVIHIISVQLILYFTCWRPDRRHKAPKTSKKWSWLQSRPGREDTKCHLMTVLTRKAATLVSCSSAQVKMDRWEDRHWRLLFVSCLLPTVPFCLFQSFHDRWKCALISMFFFRFAGNSVQICLIFGNLTSNLYILYHIANTLLNVL